MTDKNQDIDMGLGLLDQDLDSIEDLPGFEVPPTGEYLLKMTTAIKKINDKIFVETSYEVLECVKQDKEEDIPAKLGNKFSSLFTIKGDGKDAEKDAEMVRLGKGKLKELLVDIAEATGQGNLLVLVRDIVADCTVNATVKRRQDKEDKEKFYGNVKNLRLA